MAVPAAVVAIVNPVSGAGCDARALDERKALLRRHFSAARIDGAVHVTSRPQHASELAIDAVSSGAGLVIAWGGDGTTNEIACALAGTSAAMGIIPAGSGNGLAAALHLPRDADAAVAIALGTNERRVDAGEMEGRLFFNIAGIGADAAIAQRFNAQPKGRRGMGPYVRIAMQEAFRYRGRRYRITLDGEQLTRDGLIIAFANGQEYGNRIRVAPAAVVDDGRLDAVILEDRPPLMRLWHGRHLALKHIERVPGVLVRRIESASVEAEEDILFHVDGELGRAGRVVHVRVRPGVLTVRVP
jgi:diacylglycerol kinase (ATP)